VARLEVATKTLTADLGAPPPDSIILKIEGPDGAFFGFLGKCFKLREGSYDYSVCPYGDAKQETVFGGTSFKLG
jgi:hypothetical protein